MAEVTITTVNGMVFVDQCAVRVKHMEQVHWKAEDDRLKFQVDSFTCTDPNNPTVPFDQSSYKGTGVNGTDQATAQKVTQTLVFTYKIAASTSGEGAEEKALPMPSDPVVIIDPPGSGGPG